MSIVNLSAYRFASLDDLSLLRERMREHCMALDLKGTIALAPEGIDLVFDERVAVDSKLQPLPPLSRVGDEAGSARTRLPLPAGERAGVRGHAGDVADSERVSENFPASTRPSSAPSGHLLPNGEKGTTA